MSSSSMCPPPVLLLRLLLLATTIRISSEVIFFLLVGIRMTPPLDASSTKKSSSEQQMNCSQLQLSESGMVMPSPHRLLPSPTIMLSQKLGSQFPDNNLKQYFLNYPFYKYTVSAMYLRRISLLAAPSLPQQKKGNTLRSFRPRSSAMMLYKYITPKKQIIEVSSTI